MRLIARYLTAGLLAVAIAAGWLAAPAAPAHAQAGATLAPTCALDLTNTRTCDLWAKAGTIGLPGHPALPVWSYTASAAGLPGAVGPTLVATEGETLVINLTNTLGEATSLQIAGLAGAADLTGAAANGGQKSYTFSALPAGTYLYQAGITTGSGPRQIAMGLVGALVVHEAAPAAYDDEAVLVYSEIDPAFNASPSSFALQHFNPAYLLINGKAYPSTDLIATAAGHTLRLRHANAGLRFHSVGVLGLRQTVIADDGNPLPAASSIVARTLGAGQTLDSLVSIPATALDGTKYPLYETGMPANGSAGANGMGGMLTFIVAGTGVTPPPPTPTPIPADTTPPLVSGVAIASLSNSSTTLPLTAGASDNVGIASATYSIDGGAPVAFSFAAGSNVSLSASVSVAALGNGPHSVAVQAADAAGNQSNVGSASFTIDRAAPTVTSATLSPNTVAPGAAVALSATVSDALSGIASASYKVDGGTAKALTVGAGGSVQAAISTAGMAVDTSHTVVVTALDKAGNSGSSAVLTFAISDTLFTNGFESPTTQPYGWSSVGGATGRLSLATGGSQIAGTYSLRATVSGGTSGIVQQSLGSSQTALHARIYLNPTSLTYNSNANATAARTILRGVNGSSEAFRLELHRTAATSGNFEVRAVVSRQNGTTATRWYPLSAGANYVELAWAQGASSQFQIYTNGTLRQTLSGLATTAYAVSSVQLGPQGTLTGVGGNILFDNAKLTRTTLIGTSN